MIETPINQLLNVIETRTPALSKQAHARAARTHSLHDEVLATVYDYNSNTPDARRVTPRAALIVAARTINELSELPEESQKFGALRAVNSFIALASSTTSALAASAYAPNADMLPAGHPLSPNVSAHDKAAWIASDPEIADDARALVASVYSLAPGTPAHEHALTRLNLLPAGKVPGHIKLYALVASFENAASSAARRARVALQLRDSHGRWIDMGRGLNFHFFNLDGSVGSASGAYVGASADGKKALIQVKGNASLPDGIYPVASTSATSYEARLPGAGGNVPIRRQLPGGSHAPAVDPGIVDPNTTPKYADLAAARLDAPTGWTKLPNNPNAPTRNIFASDDDYRAVQQGDSFSLYRINSSGVMNSQPVGTGTSWGDMQNLATSDEKAYDAVKDEPNANPPHPLGANAAPAARALHNAKADIPARKNDNQALDAANKLAASGIDVAGNKVPDGWVASVDPGRPTQYFDRGNGVGNPTVMAGPVAPNVNYHRVIANDPHTGKPIEVSAGVWPDGGVGLFEDKLGGLGKFKSWDAAEAALPRIFDDRNEQNKIMDWPPLVKVDATKDVPAAPAPEAKLPNDATPEAPAVPNAKADTPAEPDKKAAALDAAQKLADSGIDVAGNKVPDGWTASVDPGKPARNFDRGRGNLVEITGAVDPHVKYTRVIAHDPHKNNAPVNAVARVASDGKVNVEGAGSYPSWDEASTTGVQKAFDYLNQYNKDKDWPELVPVDANEKASPTPEAPSEPDTSKAKLPVPSDSGTPSDKDSGTSGITSKPDAPEAKMPVITQAKEPKTVDVNPPALFQDPYIPKNAFMLRTAEYDPEGRIDEESTDFTDDPKKLAQRFTPDELVNAMTQALTGISGDAVVKQILDANVDDGLNTDGEPIQVRRGPGRPRAVIPNPADVVDVPGDNGPALKINHPSGHGQLEFNAGPEYVPAEALYQALFQAGMDPNRVIADIYDSVNGNDKNFQALIKAQGGIPDAAEVSLVDDIMGQISAKSTKGDVSVAHEKSDAADATTEEPLPGHLIENTPINFNNPDFNNLDISSYTPKQLEPDKNGYTDNPKLLAQYFETADLIDQLTQGIVDSSSVGSFDFGDEHSAVATVPVEAIRDALQYQGINTNDILYDLEKEANNFSGVEPIASDTATPEATLPESPAPAYGPNDSPAYDEGIYKAMQADGETPEAMSKRTGIPVDYINKAVARHEAVLAKTQGDQPEPVVDAPEEQPPAAPELAYPGPREAGYSPNNVAMDANGVVIGAGHRIIATLDGRQGTVLKIENKQDKNGDWKDYVKVRYDDGTMAVRSAKQLSAISVDAGAPGAEQTPRERRNAPNVDPNLPSRLRAPIAFPQAASADGSITPGVANQGELPAEYKDMALNNIQAKQFLALGPDRAAQIAFAGKNYVSVDSIKAKVEEYRALLANTDNLERSEQSKQLSQKLEELRGMIADTVGMRGDVAFGHGEYTVQFNEIDIPSLHNDPGSRITIMLDGAIYDSNHRSIGNITRILRITPKLDANGTVIGEERTADNEFLRIEERDLHGAPIQGNGFASAYNRFMENWYIANNFSAVHVHAHSDPSNGFIGGYVWALEGFRFDDAEGAHGAVGRMMRYAKTPAELESLDHYKRMLRNAEMANGDVDVSKLPTPMDIALAGFRSGATNWLGRKTLMNYSWNGVKDLRVTDIPVERLQALNYQQLKIADARATAGANIVKLSPSFAAMINGNAFQQQHPELDEHLLEIRNVLVNGKSLALLSPVTKNALTNYISSELLKGKQSHMLIADALALRGGLDAEFRAENPTVGSRNLGVGMALTNYSMDDVFNDRIPGFSIAHLSGESGVNDIRVARHIDTGQVFFVKNEELGPRHGFDGEDSEATTGVLHNALGVPTYATVNSKKDRNMLIMRPIGSDMPLAGDAATARAAYDAGIQRPDGVVVNVNNYNVLYQLHRPDDVLKTLLVDLLMGNQDRHHGNYMFGVNAFDGKTLYLMPVDHGFGNLREGDEAPNMAMQIENAQGRSKSTLYGATMHDLTKALGNDNTMMLFQSYANSMLENLKKPGAFVPGAQTDAIVSRWGSIDAFISVVEGRLQPMFTSDSRENRALLLAFDYKKWRNY